MTDNKLPPGYIPLTIHQINGQANAKQNNGSRRNDYSNGKSGEYRSSSSDRERGERAPRGGGGPSSGRRHSSSNGGGQNPGNGGRMRSKQGGNGGRRGDNRRPQGEGRPFSEGRSSGEGRSNDGDGRRAPSRESHGNDEE